VAGDPACDRHERLNGGAGQQVCPCPLISLCLLSIPALPLGLLHASVRLPFWGPFARLPVLWGSHTSWPCRPMRLPRLVHSPSMTPFPGPPIPSTWPCSPPPPLLSPSRPDPTRRLVSSCLSFWTSRAWELGPQSHLWASSGTEPCCQRPEVPSKLAPITGRPTGIWGRRVQDEDWGGFP
jgi:hypothetical protein